MHEIQQVTASLLEYAVERYGLQLPKRAPEELVWSLFHS